MDYSKVKIPNHVAIILDGNGRWAKERGLSRSEGHREGFTNLVNLSKHVFKTGVKVLSVYAFSTENFKRSKDEVDFLMKLFEDKFNEYAEKLKEQNVRLVFSGGRGKPVKKKLIDIINKCEEMTKDCTGGTMNICFNYGSHLEMVEAIKRIHNDINAGIISEADVTEDMIYHYMFQDLPPIDFLIRTSGELRLSNFMLYQASYAEFYFPKTYFPAFNEEEFDKALIEYTSRDRRFGGINYEDKNN
jgi:undecaprenyl diphosphate synthase